VDGANSARVHCVRLCVGGCTIVVLYVFLSAVARWVYSICAGLISVVVGVYTSRAGE
jgi:inner membrane protein involved in colicin E2 resistance